MPGIGLGLIFICTVAILAVGQCSFGQSAPSKEQQAKAVYDYNIKSYNEYLPSCLNAGLDREKCAWIWASSGGARPPHLAEAWARMVVEHDESVAKAWVESR